ncbi:hypothetical protein [Actinomadura violacea]|uniref:Uncharacterized protein n=1 Tax=Actinomadura violacea TaxID=2819934 RepID=A0ABS3RPB0_9ACTN|nr:hypothetical protein [Actinomadura violacea]MBO2458584.1 hypothetical protein [Actinomadura violacea]
MSVHTPTGRRTLAGVIATTTLLAPLLVTASAHASTCWVSPSGKLVCNPTSTRPGGSGGGGGGSGGGSGGDSGPVAPPPPEGLTPNQAIGVAPVPGGNAPLAPAPANTQTLVEEALTTASFPVPSAHTAPKGKTYVRVKTSLWVGGFKVVKTDKVSAGAQTVQAVATPASVTWNLGKPMGQDTIIQTCENAGSENGRTCTYTYQRSSAAKPGGAYQITATINWNIDWTCEGDDCQGHGGDLPQQSRTSPLTPLTVGEIQTTTSQ